MVDANGNTTTFSYSSGKLVEIVDPFSRDTDLTYTSGLLTTFTDLAGRGTTLAYTSGQLDSVTLPDPDGAGSLAAPVYGFTYDSGTDLLATSTNPLSQSTTYSFDSGSFRVTSIAHPDSATWQLTPVQTIGLATSSWNSLSFPADAVGLITDERSKEWEFTTDRFGSLKTWADPYGNTTQFERDHAGRVYRLTQPDPDGSGATYTSPITKFSYSLAGDLVKEVLPDSNTRTYTYNGLSRVLTFTNELGKVWTNTYDASGNLTGAENPLGDETTYTYTALGQLETITTPDPDAAGALAAAVTEFAYDADGRLQTITFADASTQEFAYNSADRLVTLTDELSNDWTFTWDSLDRRTSSTNPLSETTDYHYDAASRLSEVVDPLGNDTDYTYNNRGWLTQIASPDPDGGGSLARVRWYMAYDVAGNLIYEGDDPYYANSSYESRTYDNAGRLLTLRQPGTAQFSTFEYDNLGRVKKRSESNTDVSRYTKFVYNARSRVTSEIKSDPFASPLVDGPTTSFTYSASGQTLSLTDPVGNATSWTYDDAGRLIEEENELADSRFFEYDHAGRLIERTDRLGRDTRYEYDARNRLTAEKWYSGATLLRTLSFDYDVAGRLTQASDPAATYDFTYDAAGRVLTETQDLAALGFDITYASTWNDNGRRTVLAAALGSTDDFENSFTYDNMSRLTSVTQQDVSGGNVLAEKRVDVSYSAYGAVKRLARYADTAATEHVASTFFRYDEFGRADKIVHTTDTTAPSSGWGTGVLAGYLVEWDAGNRVVEIDSYLDGVSTFAYDNWDQIDSADHNSQSDESYTYDDNGNRTGGGYDTDPNNQLASDGAFDYTYDAEGNRLTRTKISNGYVTEYAWDHRNRLISVTEKNNASTVLATAEYEYDVFGQRLSKEVDADGPGSGAAVLSVFSWEGNQINLQFDGSAAADLTHRYLWNPAAVDQVLADETVTSLSSEGDVLWPLADHQGTLRDLAVYDAGTDATSIANHREYNAYGELTGETDDAVDHLFAYTGRERDDETGLQYHRARYYDPAVGRWLSEDPISFAAGDTNINRMVGNNPVSMNDPTGLQGSSTGSGEMRLTHAMPGFLITPQQSGPPLVQQVIPYEFGALPSTAATPIWLRPSSLYVIGNPIYVPYLSKDGSVVSQPAELAGPPPNFDVTPIFKPWIPSFEFGPVSAFPGGNIDVKLGGVTLEIRDKGLKTGVEDVFVVPISGKGSFGLGLEWRR